MSSKAMSLKSQIKEYAKKNKLPVQVVLQNYMFERLLERLARSKYKDNFILKGGMLISAIVGLDTRSTMDVDTTLTKLSLTEKTIRIAVESICNIDLNDDVDFQIISVLSNQKKTKYGGFCVRLDATYDSIITPLSIDISTGDIITPKPIPYKLHGILDKKIRNYGFCL